MTSQAYHPEEKAASPLNRLDACILLTRERQLPGVLSAVLKHVAYRAGGLHECCFQKLNEMARDIGFSKRTVQNALDRLVDMGLLLKTKGGFGRGDASVYMLRFEIKVAGDSAKIALRSQEMQEMPPKVLPINGTPELKSNLTLQRTRDKPSDSPETPNPAKVHPGCPDCRHPSYRLGNCDWCKYYGPNGRLSELSPTCEKPAA